MYILKDYAPYFRKKEEWEQKLKNLNISLTKGLFVITIAVCVAQLFVK